MLSVLVSLKYLLFSKVLMLLAFMDARKHRWYKCKDEKKKKPQEGQDGPGSLT